MRTEQQRYDRERTFHNWVFNGKTRASLAKYYSIADTSENYYRQQVLARGGRSVLEIGCGRYSIAPLLGNNVCFAAIDISDVAVAEAARVAHTHGQMGSYLLMNAENTAFADKSFDVVCGTGILHHLNLNKACAEINRILKPNGLAVFVEPLGHNPLINLYRTLTPQIRSLDEHPLLSNDLQTLRSYFGHVEVRHFYLLSLAAVPFRKWSIFLTVKRTLELLDDYLFRFVPISGRYAWMAVMTMSDPRAIAQ